MFALVDCKNFFVSCEQVFAPHLNGRPVVVLSNNDGCIIARSEEAKALDIPMGVPLFKVRDIISKYDVKLFSSNFALYNDMSNRIMDIISQEAPQMEPYSVDEAFVYFPFSIAPEKAVEWGANLKRRLVKELGLPVRVGLGPTKTLAKLANALSKKTQTGVKHIGSENLASVGHLPVTEVWGIGHRSEKKLHRLGINTIADFISRPQAFIRKHFTVTGVRTAHELQGISCIKIIDVEQPFKSRLVSRSFNYEVTEKEVVKKALVHFCHIAGRKLRRSHQCTECVGVFVRTSPHQKYKPLFSNNATLTLSNPTNDTLQLIKAIDSLVDKVFVEGYAYKKAGITLLGLSAPSALKQRVLFEGNVHQVTHESPDLMSALDTIHHRYGRFSAGFGKYGCISKRATPKIANKKRLGSHQYTTKWSELVKV